MSKRGSYDAVVVGGGHNGLVCAAYLAKAGLKVRVVEKQSRLGGAAVTEEFHPGFRNSVYSYAVSLLNPKVVQELDLHRHGLKILRLAVNGWKRFVPISEDEHFAMSVDEAQLADTLDSRFRGDGKAMAEFNRRLAICADALRSIALDTPPNIDGDIASVVRGLLTAKKLRHLDRDGRAELIKLMTMSVGDYLDELFGGEVIKGVLGYSATVGNMQSVYSAGSAYVLLHHVFGEVDGVKGQWGQAVGGMGAITAAMAAAARHHGAELSTGVGVRELIVEKGRATGIVLDDGSIISAGVVVSNLNPRLLFTTMVDESLLPAAFNQRMKNWRCSSGIFRMNVALSELPDFTSSPGKDPTTYKAASVLTAPSLAYLDQAFDDAKNGGISKNPVIELQIPSIQDRTLAPEGCQVASMFCEFFSYERADKRSWDEIEDEVADKVIDHYSQFAPNFKGAIVGRQIKSPLAIERDLGMVRGDIFHGALHLDQIFSMRPAPGYADYRSPIAGLYMCGSGTHPGGGVTGAPGHNAAREILRDLKPGWLRQVLPMTRRQSRRLGSRVRN